MNVAVIIPMVKVNCFGSKCQMKPYLISDDDDYYYHHYYKLLFCFLFFSNLY